MTQRLLALASALLLLLAVASASAEEGFSSNLYEGHPQALCSEVCALHEACIDGRCVDNCAPSCREGTYCAPSAECLPLPHVQSERATEQELMIRRGQESMDATKVALIDLGGIVFLGARATYEWGQHHAWNVRLQWMNTGFTTYKIEQQTEFERVEWGFGSYFGYRRYEKGMGNLRGFFYGGGISYHFVGVRDIWDQKAAIWTHYPGFYGELGYRWVFGDFVFGFGPALGVRIPVFSHFQSTGPGSCADTNSCTRSNESRFEGTMTVEVGWFL